MFENQVDYIFENNFQFISGKQLLELISCPTNYKSSTRYICFTFDDCYENNYSIVRPILLQKKIPAKFFAATSKLGSFSDWDDCHSRQSIMTRKQIKEMSLSFDIGSHTQHHVRLANSKPNTILNEISNSKKELTELLGREILFFAYPYGSYNSEVVKYVSQSQFEVAFTIEQHTNYYYKEQRKTYDWSLHN